MILPAIEYKPGWSFRAGGPGGRFLCVFARTVDSLHKDRMRTTQHQFEVPDGLDDQGFARWVLDRVVQVERHEASEFLTIDGTRPFWPNHEEGDPYAHVEHWGATLPGSDRAG